LSELPILDPQPLRDLLAIGAADGLIQELIGLFQEDVPTRVALLNMTLAAGDADHAVAEAHQLKGALGSLGLVRFAELASRIEAAAREGQVDGARQLAEGLGPAYAEGLEALEAAFPVA
jgi:HPt (histidine-containing phosphotransfer) domain-containing protein